MSRRLGLGAVGRRDVAGVEAALGDGERFAQEGDVGALRLDQRLVGEHVGVGGNRVEQHALADIAQRLAARLHLEFCGAHVVGGAETVEQGLRHSDADDPRLQIGGLDGVVGQQIAHRLQPGAEACHDLRPIAGERLRHVLVGGALTRALGIELRVGLVGLGERLRQGFRPCGGGQGATERQRGPCREHRSHARPMPRHHATNSGGTPNHVIPQIPAVRPRRRRLS
ncbi:hypothetical protein ACVWYI_003107 [Bradyrhizobium sp. LB13.1]